MAEVRSGSLTALVYIFFQAEDGIRDHCVTGVQTCALPISGPGMARLLGGGGTSTRSCGPAWWDRRADVNSVGGAGHHLFARRSRATRKDDPQCHVEDVPRDRPRGALGSARAVRPRSGGVHESHTSCPIVLRLPRQKKERLRAWKPEHTLQACRTSWSS